MEAANLSGVEDPGQPLRISLSELKGSIKGGEGCFAHPTAEEVTRLTFGKYRDYRSHTQKGFNYFARLLNRGSSQE
jgi:hypothetical protein